MTSAGSTTPGQSAVLCDLEIIQGCTSGRDVENTGADRVWDGIAEEFTEDQAVTALVEKLHRVCGDRESVANIRVIFNDLSLV